MVHLITSESIWHKFIWDKKYDGCFSLQDFDYISEILKDIYLKLRCMKNITLLIILNRKTLCIYGFID